MCDASDYAVGAVLGQRVDKKLNVIQYASKTLDSAYRNYVCRGFGVTYANGWLLMVGASRTSPVPGNGMRRRHAHRRILPSFGALCGDNTPTAALRGLRMITKSVSSYKWLLELFG